MLKTLKTALIAAACLCAGSTAQAASLGLVANGPSVSVGAASLDYTEFGGEGSFTGFGAVSSVTGLNVPGPISFFMEASFDLTPPNPATFGTLDVSGGGNALILGDLVGFGFTADSLEFLFDVFGGSIAGAVGPQVLVTFDSTSPLSFLSGLSDGDVLQGTARAAASPAPIPLPAGTVLLLTGLGALSLTRRKMMMRGA